MKNKKELLSVLGKSRNLLLLKYNIDIDTICFREHTSSKDVTFDLEDIIISFDSNENYQIDVPGELKFEKFLRKYSISYSDYEIAYQMTFYFFTIKSVEMFNTFLLET